MLCGGDIDAWALARAVSLVVSNLPADPETKINSSTWRSKNKKQRNLSYNGNVSEAAFGLEKETEYDLFVGVIAFIKRVFAN